MLFFLAVTWLLLQGVGIWGVNIPVAWGFAIMNFVWWIGIGHAGTFISAILLLLFQQWRTAINRFTEAMTLFAVACAGSVSVAASGPAVGFLLAVAVSRHDGTLAAVPQPAGLGRFCSQHLFHGLALVLVSSVWCRIWRRCAIAQRRSGRKNSTASSRWAGVVRPRTGNVIRWRICCWQDWRRRWCSQCTASSVSILPSRSSRLAFDNFPAVFRGRRDLLRVRHGAEHRDSGSQDLSPGDISSPSDTSTTWRTSCW